MRTLAAILVLLTLAMILTSVRAQQGQDYVIIDSIEAPTTSIPGQRVTVTLRVSYSFSQKAELGISIARTGSASGSDLMAQTRGGIVYGSSSEPKTGSRQYYVAIVTPEIQGQLQLTAHAFYSYGTGWITASSKDFSMMISESNGFTLPSNEFTGSVQYANDPSLASSATEAGGSISASLSGSSISIGLGIPNPTNEAQTEDITYLIGIDVKNEGGSVQNPEGTYEIRIINSPGVANATFETGEGSRIKPLDLSVGANGYVINGLDLNDLGNSRSFSLYAVGYRVFQNTTNNSQCTEVPVPYVSGVAIDGMVESFGGGGFTSYPSCVQVGTPEQSYFALVIWNSPQGGWAPVSLPANLLLSTPTTVSVDGSPHQAGQVIIPIGVHSISAPAVVPMESGTQLIFDHWNDGLNSSSRTLTVNGDTDLTAFYRAQLTPSAVSTVLTMLGAFKGWAVGGVVQQTDVVTVNKPVNIKPIWDYTSVVLITILIIGAVVMGILLVRHKETRSREVR